MSAKGQKELTPEEAAIQEELRLGRLQRQYDIMEKTRNMGQCLKLEKQHRIIRIYNKEDRNILANLKVATAPAKRQEDIRTMRELHSVLAMYEFYDEKNKVMQEYLNELDRQIYLRQHEVLGLQNLQTNEQEHQRRVDNARSTVEKLENKLDVQVTKFGKTCTENRILRDQLTSLLHERSWFNKTWNKLIKNLGDGKRFMIDLIEQATLAYDEREEWVSKLIMLKKREKVSVNNNIISMRILERNRYNLRKLKDFLSVKSQRRIIKDLQIKGIKRRRQLIEEIELQSEKYRELLNNIYDFTNDDKIDNIARRFTQDEKTNFSRFQLIIALNKEIETLSEVLFEISDKLDNQKTKQTFMAQKQTETIEELQKQYDEILNENEKLKQKSVNIDKTIENLINGIDSLFKLFKCDNESLLRLLGDNEHINQFNVLKYLRLIEESFFEYVLSGNFKIHLNKSTSSNKKISTLQDFSLIPVDDYIKLTPCPLCIENEEVHDIVDSLQKVRDKQETQKYLKWRLSLPGGENLSHQVSQCNLPQSRAIMQMRYQ